MYWLCWAFTAAQAFLQFQVSGATPAACAGFSPQWLLLLEGMGSGTWASVVVACRLSGWGLRHELQRLQWGLWSTGSVVEAHWFSCGGMRDSLDQGLNLCLPHQQVDSLPLSPQGSPRAAFLASPLDSTHDMPVTHPTPGCISNYSLSSVIAEWSLGKGWERKKAKLLSVADHWSRSLKELTVYLIKELTLALQILYLFLINCCSLITSLFRLMFIANILQLIFKAWFSSCVFNMGF